MDWSQVTIREDVRPADAEAVRAIVASAGFFHDFEVDVAVELVEERLARGPASGYFFLFAESGGRVVAYSCYGPIACTVGSYDLYWIAVQADCRGRGLGRRLLRLTEERIAARGGRRIYVETSSRELYQPTQRFYEHCGYRREALLRDFYDIGDGKLIYCRVVAES